MRRTLVAVLITLAVIGSAPAAHAQCAGGYAPTCSLAKAAPIVFLGSIESMTDNTFHFRVEERFAGVTGRTIDIMNAPPMEGSTGYDESVTRYLVFAQTVRCDDGSEHAYVGGCGRQMIPFRRAGPDLEQLRREKRGRRVASAFGTLVRTGNEGSNFLRPGDTGVLANVVVTFRSDSATASTKTRADGTFVVERLPTGTYRIAAALPHGLKLGETILDEPLEPIEVAPDTCYNLVLTAVPTTKISGRVKQIMNADIHLPQGRQTRTLEVVLNWNGIRAADTFGAFVTAARANNMGGPYARKTGDDTYAVNLLPDETYRVSATASCKQPRVTSAATDTIVVDGSDQSVARVTLTFAPDGCRAK